MNFLRTTPLNASMYQNNNEKIKSNFQMIATFEMERVERGPLMYALTKVLGSEVVGSSRHDLGSAIQSRRV